MNAKLKQRTCANKGCSVKFVQFNSLVDWCSPLCGYELSMIRLENKKKKEKVEYKAETNRLRKDYYDKDLNHQKKLTQDVFNKLRKLEEFEWFADRGLEPECISCGKKNMDWCCGHLKTVASQGALRFDKTNTYLQCNRYCNKALSANLNGNRTTRGYLVGLAERFGDVEAKIIIEYCDVDKIKTWECDELIAMRKEMSKEIRRLGKKLNI